METQAKSIYKMPGKDKDREEDCGMDDVEKERPLDNYGVAAVLSMPSVLKASPIRRIHKRLLLRNLHLINSLAHVA